jgi:hypothetical protein
MGVTKVSGAAYARVLDLALWVGRKVPERTQDKQHPIVRAY